MGSETDERRKRLAQALRDNLRRRKAQSRQAEAAAGEDKRTGDGNAEG